MIQISLQAILGRETLIACFRTFIFPRPEWQEHMYPGVSRLPLVFSFRHFPFTTHAVSLRLYADCEMQQDRADWEIICSRWLRVSHISHRPLIGWHSAKDWQDCLFVSTVDAVKKVSESARSAPICVTGLWRWTVLALGPSTHAQCISTKMTLHFLWGCMLI